MLQRGIKPILSNNVLAHVSGEKPLRIFLLGPCHHVYIRGCGLSSLKVYETPIGDIELDLESNCSFFPCYILYVYSY